MLRRLALCFLLCATAMAASRPSGAWQAPAKGAQTKVAVDERARYAGLRYPGGQLPEGHKYIAGALVDALDGVEYGLTEVSRGRVKMLWFGRLTHRDPNGAPHWELLDVLSSPFVRKYEILTYANCFTGQTPDTEIVAIVDARPDTEFFTRVRRAWRADRRTGKFEVLTSLKGIKCANEGYGL